MGRNARIDLPENEIGEGAPAGPLAAWACCDESTDYVPTNRSYGAAHTLRGDGKSLV